MSSKVTGWVWDQDLPVQAKCVLLWLAERATDNGVCYPGQAEIRQKTGLSESMVRRYLRSLARDQDDAGQPRRPLVRIIERPISGNRNTSNVYVLLVPWADARAVQHELEELKHIPEAALHPVGCADARQGGGVHAVTPLGSTGAPQVAGAGATQEPSPPDPDREYSPLPPNEAGQQQRGRMAEQEQTARQDSTSHTPPPSSPAIEAPDDEALALVAAFYRGLGATPSLATATMQRRDFAIARQLVEAGATPRQAESYARETSGLQGRLAPVDLRSFERERPAWLARQRCEERRRVDRTGLPPTWLDGAADNPRTAPPPLQLEAVPRGPSAAVRASVATPGSGHPDFGGEHLGHALRAALLARAR